MKTMKSRKELLQSLDNEVSGAVMAYYVWKTMLVQTSSQTIVRGMNETPWAWATIRKALQCTFFIQLARVFDNSSRHSLSKVLGLFTEHARGRKVASAKGISRLSTTAKRYELKAKAYRDIRSKVYAHPVFTDTADINRMFKGTNFPECERILRFLQRCVSSLSMYELNDHDVRLRRQHLPLQANLVKETKKLMQTMKRPTLIRPPHVKGRNVP